MLEKQEEKHEKRNKIPETVLYAANEMYEMGRVGRCGQSSDLVQRRPS